ncbi:hypothetical protein [Defluviimonas sp. SAOS-178_SWC]|uniref:hypothetical protein n=1 Tax=Defluviimonas sp. SAOS-178_SWC TaxID=3121287 RepID=UPI00322190E7
MNILDWPSELPLFDVVDLWLSGSTSSSGVGLDGREQILWRENRVWRGALSLPALRGSQPMRLRALAAQLRGRFGRFRIPICNRFTPRLQTTEADFLAKIGISATDIANGYSPWSDGTLFTDGTGWALPTSAEPVIAFAAPSGARIIHMENYIGRHIEVGAYFSINDFLYRVVENVDGAVSFDPPLREAVIAGSTVNVSAPMFVCRLVSDDGMRVPEHHVRITPSVGIEVVEAFDR